MSTYRTDEEQVEALRKWWQENGRSVIAGVVIGLLVVGGGKAWIEYNRAQAENASAFYEGFSRAAAEGDLEKALERGEALIREYGRSTYALFTALELARLQYEAGEKERARDRLRWVVDNARDESLAQLARVRLARLLLDLGELDEVQALAGDPAEDAWQGEFLAIRGDLRLARGDREGARADYAAALEKGVSLPALVRMKLSELGG